MILRRFCKFLLKVVGCLVLVLIFNEFIIYYVTLAQCHWPKLPETNHVKAIILADTHMLGPFRGHWFDKLRREWQMHRAFQTSMTLFQPDVVFILGDLFDEGQWVNDKQFKEYVRRYRRLFHTDEKTKEITISDFIMRNILPICMKYLPLSHTKIFSTSPRMINRYENVFNNTDDTVLVTVKGVHFVLINSVRMEGDGCNLCRAAERKIENISLQLKCARGLTDCDDSNAIGEYSQPVLLQHFPTYRPTDSICLESDSEETELFRERWEVLSKESTRWLGKMLEPRVAFSGHSHNYCRVKNMLDIEEYTISSYSWRNKNNPKFLLALFTPDAYHVAVCEMPQESTVYAIYTIGSIVSVILVLYHELKTHSRRYYVRFKGKSN
ncbi:Metallophosphoesterase 1 like [Pseudolycoriella hygida]|uniref:Metallophosphoesterase 1 like n=1 Tax=Pseudolycoriella hygida TaxID=35572 RepID=A0A9Q0NGY4_9DIPT|nr:Metallophosphoesterase 1 like [Pseudolycoriella hygida]